MLFLFHPTPPFQLFLSFLLEATTESFQGVLFFHLFLLVGGYLLYNIVVVFVIH